ncbi:MAG: c-type cytochrome biogenesis protein CcmI, partial [Geminicoccaceae bacterium]
MLPCRLEGARLQSRAFPARKYSRLASKLGGLPCGHARATFGVPRRCASSLRKAQDEPLAGDRGDDRPALGLVIQPLLRPNAPAGTRREHDLRVYRAQLAELERERERGLLDDRTAAAARLEIQRRI